jgi:hypothetical protein
MNDNAGTIFVIFMVCVIVALIVATGESIDRE